MEGGGLFGAGGGGGVLLAVVVIVGVVQVAQGAQAVRPHLAGRPR